MAPSFKLTWWLQTGGGASLLGGRAPDMLPSYSAQQTLSPTPLVSKLSEKRQGYYSCKCVVGCMQHPLMSARVCTNPPLMSPAVSCRGCARMYVAHKHTGMSACLMASVLMSPACWPSSNSWRPKSSVLASLHTTLLSRAAALSWCTITSSFPVSSKGLLGWLGCSQHNAEGFWAVCVDAHGWVLKCRASAGHVLTLLWPACLPARRPVRLPKHTRTQHASHHCR